MDEAHNWEESPKGVDALQCKAFQLTLSRNEIMMAMHPRLTVAVRFLLQYLLFLLLQESLSKFRPIILWTYDMCLCHLSENMSDRHSTYAKAWNWGYSLLTPCRLMIVGGRIFLKQKIALTACKKIISTQYSWY